MTAPIMARKGCWTCKDRKVSCDKTVPKCLRCTKAKRECGGYGVRLTWPKENDNRASFASAHLNTNQPALAGGNYQWIHVVPTDIRLHLATSSLLGDENNGVKREQLVLPGIPDLIPSLSSHVAEGDMELIQYFESVVVNLLPALSIDRVKLGSLLVRSALYGSTPSSRAVYQSILALAAYHRGDNLAKVQRLKRAALQDLRFDADPTMCQGIQHVATNLLLCVLGLQQTFGGYHDCHSDWVGYLVGSKKILEALKQGDPAVGSDPSIILGWVYYFDVMVRFTFRHWRTEQITASVGGLGFDPDGSTVCALQFILARSTFIHGVPGISTHAHPVVRVLAEVSAIGMYSTYPGYTSTEYQRHLDDLRLKMDSVSTIPIGMDACSQEIIIHEEDRLKVARLAGLIYLERVSRSFSGQSSKLGIWAREALTIFARMETCLSPFALFFVSCELSEDEDRIIILSLFEKMKKGPHLKSFMEVRSLIQTAWNQQDLAAEGGLEYIHKLNLVMSSRDVIPSLI